VFTTDRQTVGGAGPQARGPFVLDRDNRIAVVILSNSFNAAPDALAVRILMATRDEAK